MLAFPSQKKVDHQIQHLHRAFEHYFLFWHQGQELEWTNCQKLKCLGGGFPMGDEGYSLRLLIDWYIIIICDDHSIMSVSLPAAAWPSSKVDCRLLGFPLKTKKISSSFSLLESSLLESRSDRFDKTRSSLRSLEPLFNVWQDNCELNFSANLWKSKVLVGTEFESSSRCPGRRWF